MSNQIKLEKIKKPTQGVRKQKQHYKGKIKTVYRVIFEHDEKHFLETGKYKNDGKSGFGTKTEANRFFDELKIAHRNKTSIFKPKPKPEEKIYTFREYAEKYLQFLLTKTRKSSHSTRKSEIKLLIDYFGDKPLHEIDRQDAIDLKIYLENLPVQIEKKIKTGRKIKNPKTKRRVHEIVKQVVETPRSASSVNGYMNRLRSLINEAVRSKINRAEKIDFFELAFSEVPNAKETIAINFEEFEKLLSVCTGERKHLYLQILCIFEASCRKSETKAIKKKDLNLDTQMCRVKISKQKKTGKQREPRRCYFSRRLIDAIIADGYHKKSDDDFLFDTRENKRAWETAKKLAFSDVKDEKRRTELLALDMQRSLRKSARMNYTESRILESVIDYQMSHTPKTTGRKHYDEVTEERQFNEFQRYENFSAVERRKLVVREEMPEPIYTPATLDFSFLPTFQTQTATA